MRPGIRLGVDVGTVRVGLAASDPGGILATPVETIPRDLQSGADQGAIAAAVLERDVLEVVVGLPRSLSGEEGAAAQEVRSYALSLAVRVAPTPVRLVDERLTTIDAHRNLRDSGLPGRAQRAVVDQAAAVLILQAALDAEKSSGQPPGELVGGRKPRKPRSHGSPRSGSSTRSDRSDGLPRPDGLPRSDGLSRSDGLPRTKAGGSLE